VFSETGLEGVDIDELTETEQPQPDDGKKVSDFK
jgi:hypothetical protein